MAEQPANCSIVETEKTHLSHEEKTLLAELLRPGVSIEAVIPADATSAELWRTLDACIRGMGLLEARILRLKPIIGRILLIFEQKPSLYRDLGYDTYSDFMEKGVYDTLHMHRSNAYQGKLVARDWPQVTPDRYAKALGPKKMDILSKFTTGRSSNAEEWLQVAESMKVGELKEYVTQRGLIERGEADGATFSFTTNRARLKVFDRFFSDGRVHNVVGSKDKDRILECLIEECFAEWIEKGEELQRQQARAAIAE